MTAADSIDFANLTGVGIGAVLLALVFRTLWRQEGGWRAVLDSSRSDAKVAREDSAAARADASAARSEARDARLAERECQRRVARLEDMIGEIRSAGASNTSRLDDLDGTPSGEIPKSAAAGE